MKMSLGSFTLVCLAAASFGLSASNADAAQESNKPYSLIVAFSAGGPADAAARALQPGLFDAVGNTVIVENFPGAGGSIGVNRMLAREPDGRAVLMATVAEPILPPLVMSQAGYQPQDLRLLTAAIDSYLGIVTAQDAPFSSTAELLEWAKQNPEREISYATPGVGTLFHLMGEHFKEISGANLVHVPYKGVAPGLNDVIGGVVDIAFVPLAGNIVGMINADRIKLLGTTSREPLPVLKYSPSIQDVPGFEDFDYQTWMGLFVSSAVDDQTLEDIHAAVAQAIRTPMFREHVLNMGDVPREQAQSLAEAKAFYDGEVARLQAVASQVELGGM